METLRKHSQKRDAIYKELASLKTHPSAEELYSRLKANMPDLSLGTVYRNLSVFRGEGLAVSIASVGGEERYDADTSEHSHFICENCGAVFDVDSGDDFGDLEYVSGKYGVKAVRRRLIYYGKCAKCN